MNFSACAGATSCTVLSDETGLVSTRVTPLTSGAATISAVLAPASYANPKSVQTPLLATSSALDISVLSPSVWVAQGASTDLPIKSRLLSNGKPLVASTIAYNIVKGTGSLSATTVVTDNDGFGASILHLTLLGSNIQVSVCAQPANRPCQLFSVFPVPASVFVPALCDVPCTEAGDALHFPEQAVEHVAPVAQHVEDDSASVLRAVVPGRPLR